MCSFFATYIRVDEDKGEEIGIGRGVIKGSYLSSTLFNNYAEKLTNKAQARIVEQNCRKIKQKIVMPGESMNTIK